MWFFLRLVKAPTGIKLHFYYIINWIYVHTYTYLGLSDIFVGLWLPLSVRWFHSVRWPLHPHGTFIEIDGTRSLASIGVGFHLLTTPLCFSNLPPVHPLAQPRWVRLQSMQQTTKTLQAAWPVIDPILMMLLIIPHSANVVFLGQLHLAYSPWRYSLSARGPNGTERPPQAALGTSISKQCLLEYTHFLLR